jgi:hypothetical protein
MQNLGKHFNKVLYALAAIALLFNYASLWGQKYVLTTYNLGADSLVYDICLKSIDIGSAVVEESLFLSNKGTIWLKTPIILGDYSNPFYLVITEDGEYSKNSGAIGHPLVYYSIINKSHDRLRTIKSDSIEGAFISFLQQNANESGFRMQLKFDSTSRYSYTKGLYTLDNQLNLTLIHSVANADPPDQIEYLSNHKYLRPIAHLRSHELYFGFINSNYWLYKLPTARNAIDDSLLLRQSGGQATIFAYHQGRDKFYCFHLNYEMHGKFVEKNRRDYYCTPEVLVYDPNNLRLLERHTIVDYPEGNYPGKENGIADVVGDYIVYYFFQDDWMGIYAPAMLFIFDTRTSQATWLRVGWR